MSATEQPVYDLEEPETMPMFHYRVSVPNQQERYLIAYGSDETQAFGRVLRSLGNAPDKKRNRGRRNIAHPELPQPDRNRGQRHHIPRVKTLRVLEFVNRP